jgi:glutamine amidotransferase
MGFNAEITENAEKIKNADKVIFPGVGEAKTTMSFLKAKGLDELIKNLKQPVLGICLGLQLMCSHSEEGDVQCLGIFPEKVKKFNNSGDNTIKIPEMGWNTINKIKGDLFNENLEGKYVYFVHSYYAEIGEHTTAVTEYINPFSSSLQKDNFFATQFHPEKSGDVGGRILKKFIEL